MIRRKYSVVGVSGLRKPTFPASGASVSCYLGGRVKAKTAYTDLYEFSIWEKLCKVIIKKHTHTKQQQQKKNPATQDVINTKIPASCSPFPAMGRQAVGTISEVKILNGTALLSANTGEPGGASVTLLWSPSLLLTHTSEETSLTQH